MNRTKFTPTRGYKEVSLASGLYLLTTGLADKLYSDGLNENEYIAWDKKRGFYGLEGLEGLGYSFETAFSRLRHEDWVIRSCFYILEEKELNIKTISIDQTLNQEKDDSERDI